MASGTRSNIGAASESARRRICMLGWIRLVRNAVRCWLGDLNSFGQPSNGVFSSLVTVGCLGISSNRKP